MITAAALLLFTLLYLAFTMDRAWSNVTLPERNDLVFEGRHQGYGAYQLRKEYDHRLVLAFGCTVGLLALLAALPKVISWFAPSITLATPVPPVIIADFVVPPIMPDYPPPSKKNTTVSSIKRPDATSLLVPVDSVLITPPDTIETTAQTTLTPPLGSTGDGTMGSDSARNDALIGGLDMGKEPIPIFKLDELPVFPGGDAALAPWVRHHLVVPEGLATKDVVYVQFTVGKDGEVTDARALTGNQALCREAAESTVAHMPRWKPARMNGHDVPCRLTLPIRFEVR